MKKEEVLTGLEEIMYEYENQINECSEEMELLHSETTQKWKKRIQISELEDKMYVLKIAISAIKGLDEKSVIFDVGWGG